MAKAIEHKFKFDSKKGQKVDILYKPVDVNVKEPKAFQGYLEKVVDLLQCTDYGVPKKKSEPEKPKEPEQPKIKGIDEV